MFIHELETDHFIIIILKIYLSGLILIEYIFICISHYYNFIYIYLADLIA